MQWRAPGGPIYHVSILLHCLCNLRVLQSSFHQLYMHIHRYELSRRPTRDCAHPYFARARPCVTCTGVGVYIGNVRLHSFNSIKAAHCFVMHQPSPID
jgi:hypothetical protein